MNAMYRVSDVVVADLSGPDQQVRDVVRAKYTKGIYLGCALPAALTLFCTRFKGPECYDNAMLINFVWYGTGQLAAVKVGKLHSLNDEPTTRRRQVVLRYCLHVKQLQLCYQMSIFTAARVRRGAGIGLWAKTTSSPQVL